MTSYDFPTISIPTDHLSTASIVRHGLVALIPPVGAVISVVLWLQGMGPEIEDLALLVILYVLNMLGMEVALHRYFAHRAFKAGKYTKTFLAILGSLAYMGPLIWWVAIHRIHHMNTDGEGDPHTPWNRDGGLRGKIKGIFKAHIGWLFDPSSARPQGWGKYAVDLYRDPILFRIHMAYDYWLLFGLLAPAVIGGLLSMSWKGALLGFIWGGTVRIFLVTNAVWAVNSLAHSFGRRPFVTPRDQSRNIFWLALLTFGAGWHNNHHAFPQYATTGLRWWQIDISGWFISALEKAGLIWDVRWPESQHDSIRDRE
jgi:stearoyl-CoA desaturase (delta-9 desaturase)